jgi:coiled-coil domain-containing protein 130
MQPFNKYYPPDYDGKSNINKMAGTHALGRRAHKLNQGILIVRFEMPFNIWCGSCDNHIGQGVRFNAEKKRIGNYYSTPIWSFRMKCHLCSAWFEIKTDPEHTRYVIVDGAKRQAEEWDNTDQGVVQLKGLDLLWNTWLTIDASEQKKMDDPFYRLEKDEEDKVKASEQHQVISKLYDMSQRQWSDPWAQSQKLRKAFREEKKVLKAKAKLTEDIRNRSGLHIDLLPEAEEDTVKAQMVEYDGPEGREAALRRRELKNGSLVLGKRDRTGDTKKEELGRIIKINTRERVDPFLRGQSGKLDSSVLKAGVKVVKKRDEPENGNRELAGLVDGYTSDSE